MDCSTPGFPVLHYLLEFAQIHVHWVSDAIQPSHSLSSPSPPALNLSQHQGLFQWVGSSHQMAKVLELQHQSFQWISRVDFLQSWLVWSLCSPKDSQESSPRPKFKDTNFNFIYTHTHIEKEMATHPSTLARKISWTEKPGRLQSMGSQRVEHDWTMSLHFI